MSAAARQHKEKGVFDLLDEAAQLLRTAPATTWLIYYAGSAPFVLGALYFWEDMRSSPLAGTHASEQSLEMGALYLWMKWCHAAFSSRVRAQAAASGPPGWSWRRRWQVLALQAVIQPASLFVLPLLLLPFPPFSWAAALRESSTALCGQADASFRQHVKRAWRQAALWPRQAAFASAVLFAAGLVAFLNWMTVCAAIPHLLKTFFGIDSAFVRGGSALMNSTLAAASLGLAFLCIDPLAKAVYSLRCFYGESIQSGEDIKSELKRHAADALRWGSAVILAWGLFISTAGVSAAETAAGQAKPPAAESAAPSVGTDDLDRALERTIHGRKYLWRLPPGTPDAEESEEEGPLTRFFKSAAKMIGRWASSAADWLGDLWNRLFSGRQSVPNGGGLLTGAAAGARLLVYGLVAAAVALLVLVLAGAFARRRSASRAARPVVAAPPVDLSDENTGADRLPEDGWIKLAHELIARGDLRLAMRAFYFASLAHLASRNLIGLARFKSNRDYEAELRRRAHSAPELLPVFRENLFLFESIWYGTHEATPDSVQAFAAGVDKIKGAA